MRQWERRLMVGTIAATRLHMAPKYDGTRWVATQPEEMPEAGYGPAKTLLLQGPKPFFHRIFQKDDYEQAVLKFMAGDNVSRVEAQGNMDAYLRNPNDWAVNRLQEQRTGRKINYWDVNPNEIVLVALWSIIVLAVVGRVVYSISEGVGFYDFLSW